MSVHDSKRFVIREAYPSDWEVLHRIRMAVKENILSNPDLVTRADYIRYVTVAGKGWLCEVDGEITGFAIIDTERHNIWALFMAPEWEGRGIGKQLQQRMLDWHFGQSDASLWLSTGQNTRAERFYERTGWKRCGLTDSGERRFEISKDEWLAPSKSIPEI